ncbi:MAG: reverse transcriptase/maturase family protein [Patescibacteria group bacterium]
MKKFSKSYQEIISLENLLLAWKEFLAGKSRRRDVALFQGRLMDNIQKLREELAIKTYYHDPYQAFNISDPKPRNIHKATVRDRLLHHLLYRETYTYFDRRFIADSFSCRLEKGTHRAIYRFRADAHRASRNGRHTAWILKGDIRKFFASIDHEVLKGLLAKYIEDQDLLWLFGRVIDSFATSGRPGVGLPLGNLTSQLLVNVYLNEFDQFVKRTLRIKYYIRYADDFLILSSDREDLVGLLSKLVRFLESELKLSLHPKKVSLKTLTSGSDFLGWVEFGDHRVIRTVTKKRMIKKISASPHPVTLASYKGMLKHGDSYKLRQSLNLLD